jgi:hypothetical protein
MDLFDDAVWTTLPDYVSPAKRLCLHSGRVIPDARSFVAEGTEFPCVVTPAAPFKLLPSVAWYVFRQWRKETWALMAFRRMRVAKRRH